LSFWRRVICHADKKNGIDLSIITGFNLMIYILGIDAGTTAFKAVLFDQNGKEMAVATHEYNLNYSGIDIVELDVEKYWEACTTVIRTILSKWNGRVSDIKALAIASQGETLITLDREGKPLRPAIVWLDNRASKEANKLKGDFGVELSFKKTGQPDIVPTWPAAKILWIKNHEPNLFNKIAKYLLLEDYLVYRLTNKFVTEGSLLSSTLMFDINKGQWWNDMLQYIGINSDQLPEIKNSGQIVSELTENAARELSLSKETLVVTGALDQAASTIGAGNTRFGMITESTGSTLAICANVSQPIFDPEGRIPCHFHAIPGAYFLLPWCQTAGMVYKWFRDEFYNENKNSKDIDTVALFKRMDEEAAHILPGSNGLIMLPHLAGAFTPESNPRARGVYFGISLQTGKAHFTRAIMESVAYMLKRNIGLLEYLGIEVHEIRSIGGGSKSALWNSIKSDVCQKSVVTVQTSETTSLGAAMLACRALNLYNNLELAAGKMIHLHELTKPNPANEAVYSIAYEKYIDLYDALESLF
jgi:xylulokinase